MKFAVKKDRYFVGAAYALAPIGLLSVIIGIFLEGFGAFLFVAAGLFAGIAGTFLLWALTRSYIELNNEYIIHHFGPLQRAVTLDRIRAIRYTRDTSLDMIWSATRLELWLFPHDVVTIGMPEDEEAFLHALEQKIPDINTKDRHAAL
ncbi:PH domain-containing protein [Ectobacillus sp. JY-23]|uniref:PH domain-containing protein n=1 Tax=Ectobacillus sp. JY-23 TaxID=2933872 RepID=UPI001FF19A55|nr:PH domain-containing protein [Ectobacillus sp. JY-23]UOY91938.1 PH domain-containing protein [Ectobacillus sp. JY-23]